MFCQKCGNALADGSAFCPACGTAINAQPSATPAPEAFTPQGAPEQGYPQQSHYPTAPAQPSAAAKAFSGFVNVLKGIFSKNVVKVIGSQAKSTGPEWLIGIIISILSFALATPVNILEGFSQLIKDISGGLGGMVMKYIQFPFFSFFGASLLIGIVVLAAMVGGIWLLAKLVAKKNVPFICVLNLVGAATLPLSICYVANMLLGLIGIFLPIAVSVVAIIMTFVLLYVGFQKLEKPLVSPFYPYTALTAAVVVIAVLMSVLLYKAVITDWVGVLTSSALSGLGDLANMGGLFN